MIPFRNTAVHIRPNSQQTTGLGEALRGAGAGLSDLGQSAMRVSGVLKQQDLAKQSFESTVIVDDLRTVNERTYQEALAGGDYKAAREITKNLPDTLLASLPEDLLPEVRREQELRIRHDANQRQLQREGQIRSEEFSSNVLGFETALNGDTSANVAPEVTAEQQMEQFYRLQGMAASASGRIAAQGAFSRGMANSVQAQVARSVMAIETADDSGGIPAEQKIGQAIKDMENTIGALTQMNGKDGYNGAMDDHVNYLNKQYTQMVRNRDAAMRTARVRATNDTLASINGAVASLRSGQFSTESTVQKAVLGVVGTPEMSSEIAAAALLKSANMPQDPELLTKTAGQIAGLREYYRSEEGRPALAGVIFEQSRPLLEAQAKDYADGKIPMHDSVKKSVLVLQGQASRYGVDLKYADGVATYLSKTFETYGGTPEGVQKQREMVREYPEMLNRYLKGKSLTDTETLGTIASALGRGTPVSVSNSKLSMTEVSDASSRLLRGSSSIAGYSEMYSRLKYLGLEDADAHKAIGALVAARIPDYQDLDSEDRDKKLAKEFAHIKKEKDGYSAVEFGKSSLSVNVLGGFAHDDFIRTTKEQMYNPAVENGLWAEAGRSLTGSWVDKVASYMDPLGQAIGSVTAVDRFGANSNLQSTKYNGSALGTIPMGFGSDTLMACYGVPNTPVLNTLVAGLSPADKANLMRRALLPSVRGGEASYLADMKQLGWKASGTDEVDADMPVKALIAGMLTRAKQTALGVRPGMLMERRGSNLVFKETGVTEKGESVPGALMNTDTGTEILISGAYATAMEEAAVVTRSGALRNSSADYAVFSNIPRALRVSAQDFPTAQGNLDKFITETEQAMADFERYEKEARSGEDSRAGFAMFDTDMLGLEGGMISGGRRKYIGDVKVGTSDPAKRSGVRARSNEMREMLLNIPRVEGKYQTGMARFGELSSGRKKWERILELARKLDSGYGNEPGTVIREN